MSLTSLKVLSHKYTGGRENHSKTAVEGRSLSIVKTVLVVLFANIVISVAIGMVVAKIILSEVEFPPFIREFLTRPFSYM